jgi:hypothetical protein
MQLPGAEPESAAAAIERLRHQPGGVLIQTTHWQERLSRSLWVVFAAVGLLVLTEGIGHTARERLISLAIMGTPVAIVVAYWAYVRGRSGIVATTDGLVSKGAFSRAEPIDPSVALEEGTLPTVSRSLIAEYRGLLKRGSKWNAVPGLAVRAGVTGVPGVSYRPENLVAGSHRFAQLLTRKPSRLMTRPMRPWYRVPARATIHEDVIWESGDDAHAIRAAIGLATAPTLQHAARNEPSTASRLERWNGEAA